MFRFVQHDKRRSGSAREPLHHFPVGGTGGFGGNGSGGGVGLGGVGLGGEGISGIVSSLKNRLYCNHLP